MLKFLRNVTTIITLLVGIILAGSNTHLIPLRLWPFTGGIELPLWIILLGGFSSGLIIGSAVMTISLIQRNFTISRLNKKIKTLTEDQEQQDDTLKLPQHDLQE